MTVIGDIVPAISYIIMLVTEHKPLIYMYTYIMRI